MDRKTQENQIIESDSVTENAIEKEETENNIYVLQDALKNAKSDQNELGTLGQFFGGYQNASINIIGLVALIFVIMIFIRWTFCGETPPDVFLTTLMTILGYLFGKI